VSAVLFSLDRPKLVSLGTVNNEGCKKRNRSHTNTRQEQRVNTTQHRTRTTPQNDHTKNHPPHLTPIEGGAATASTTSKEWEV